MVLPGFCGVFSKTLLSFVKALRLTLLIVSEHEINLQNFNGFGPHVCSN